MTWRPGIALLAQAAEPGGILAAEPRGAPRRRQTELVLANRVQGLRSQSVAHSEPAHLLMLRLSLDTSHPVAEQPRRGGVAQALAVHLGGRAEGPRPPHLEHLRRGGERAPHREPHALRGTSGAPAPAGLLAFLV